MAFGQIPPTRTRPFGSRTLPLTGGSMPPLYNLDFWANSYLGVPFYQFTSNWDQVGATVNFESENGGPANVGDRVVSWKNMWLNSGEGDAVINPNEFLAINKPFLRQRTYGGETYKGLEFTGTEYLQINGSTVSDAYGVPEPIFSTGGTSWQGNTGASFLFVIDQSPDYTAGTYTSPVQSLFYSRQPNLQGSPPATIPNPWPNTENLGVQFLRNHKPNASTDISTELAVGPQATMQGIAGFFTALVRSPIIDPQGFGGAEMVNIPNDQEGAYLEYGAGLNFKARFANSGFQVILLEYDNVDKVRHQDVPGFGGDRIYNGPSVKIYGMSNPNNPIDQGGFSLPWNGLDLTVPKITFTNPMLRNHTLFDKAHAFLGGVPAIKLEPFLVGQQGNGFRGIIYEVLMLDGILSKKDKLSLSKQLVRKYGSALT
jgi:hypothetical protein